MGKLYLSEPKRKSWFNCKTRSKLQIKIEDYKIRFYTLLTSICPCIVDEMKRECHLIHDSSKQLYVQLCAPDDGRRNRLKGVERL